MTSRPYRAGDSTDGLYRIAAVSKLTGIPVPTIRVWESRHAAVQPTRNAGNVRLYTRADIERLALIKAAVDAGHAISTVASLSDKQIRARFKGLPAREPRTRASGCRVLVCGAALATVLQTAWQARFDVRVQDVLPALPATESGPMPVVDAVIVDVPVATNDLPAVLRRLRAATQAPIVILVYGFSTRQVLARLDAADVIALAAPTDPAQLARICQLGLAVDPAPPAAFSRLLMHSASPRRYTDTFLQQLSQMPSNVQCDCPNHLADLVTKLNAFEHYSLACESSNAKDAAMHAMMYSASGHCRALLEEVLRRLLAHEGIPEPSGGRLQPDGRIDAERLRRR
ncbi:MAG: MerR family transcriptional regulator [Aquabacterium sp.]|nr:MerR family transcriptional regulator [Aquabacterium sp.]